MFERAGVGIGLADIDGRIIQVNRVFGDMLGYEPGELAGREISEITHAKDIDQTEQNRRQTIDKEKPYYRIEKRYVTKGGETIRAQITSTPVFDADGKFLYTTAVVEDITARREAEAALQQSESRLAEAQRVTRTGSWERDLASGEEVWSDELYRICGLDAGTAQDARPKILDMVHPGDAELVGAEIQKLAQAGGACDAMFRIVTPDGAERVVRSRGARVGGGEGEAERIVGTMTDITEFSVAERALAESEGRFRAIFEGAPSAIFIATFDGVFQQCNPAVIRMLGYSEDEIIGKHFSEITHPDDLGKYVDLSDRLMAGEFDGFNMEKRFVRKDGSVLWAHLSVSLLKDENGEAKFRIAMIDDISKRKEALDALEESQARLLEAQQVAKVGNWVIYYSGTEQAEVHWSAEQCRIFGIAEGGHPINFQSYLDYVLPDDRPQVEAAWSAALDSDGTYDLEHRIVRPDGTVRHISTHARFSDEGGDKGRRCVGASIDITDFMQAEAALRESEARLAEAQRIAHVGNWEFDNKTGSRLWSDETYRIFGQDKARFDPSGDGFFEFIHADDRERFMRNVSGDTAQRGPHTHEYRILRPDGDVRTLREHYVSEFGESGKLLRRAGTVQDITDMKQAEEQLQQAQKMQAVGQLTGGIAHDFNNLLAVMMGNLELVRDRVLDDTQALDLIDRGLVATERGAALTHRLLAFSRRQTLQPSVIDMNALVSDMADMLSRTLGETVKIEMRAGEGLWSCEADQSQLENALLNLAINARDAMAGGGRLIIETANRVLDAEYAAQQSEVIPGPYVMLSVRDDGEGISSEALEHVFEPFFTTKPVGKGSGLGLSMVYGFVKQSGGHVEIESTEDVGTTINIYLPRMSASADDGVESGGEDIRTGRGEGVLLVEDDPEVRELAIDLLKDLGYRVASAETADEAYARLAELGAVDLLLTDVVLPGRVNGVELSRNLLARYPDLKIVYMTGYADDAIARHGKPENGGVYLPKPFRRAELSLALENALRGAAAE